MPAEHGRAQGTDVSEPASPTLVPTPLRPALWLLVFSGPALRTSLLGCLLVAEQALGQAFSLSAETLAILVEGAIFGGLLAVFLVPPLVASAGIRSVAIVAAVTTLLCLAIAIAAAPLASNNAGAVVGLFLVTGLLGFFVALLSPVSQTLLNSATMSDASARHSLQSAWSAGQPAGFIVASLTGGMLVENFGWWATLTVPLGFALLATVALLDRQIAPSVARKSTSPAPSAIEIGWIVLALIAFEVWSTWGSLKSWLSPGVLAAFAAALGILAVALNRIRRSPEPAISPKPFTAAGFAAATSVLFIYQFPTTAEFEVLLLTQLGHMSAGDIGTRTAIGNVGQIAGTAVAAALLLRHRAGRALTLGFALTTVGLGGYVLYPWWDGFVFTTVTRTIAGLGTGVLTPVLFVLALNRMPAALQVAAGTWLVLALIGGTEVGLAIFDVVLKAMTETMGSTLGGYVAVESAQLVCGMATAALTGWLVMRGSLPLTADSGTASGSPTPSRQ